MFVPIFIKIQEGQTMFCLFGMEQPMQLQYLEAV